MPSRMRGNSTVWIGGMRRLFALPTPIAADCNIYVGSRRAAERVLASITQCGKGEWAMASKGSMHKARNNQTLRDPGFVMPSDLAVAGSPLLSTALCEKPHVQWRGRVSGRNPRHSTRSAAVFVLAPSAQFCRLRGGQAGLMCSHDNAAVL